MKGRWTWTALALALAVGAARADAAAQERGTTRTRTRSGVDHTVHVSTHDGTRHEVLLEGDVEFTDDDRGVARLSPGGWFTIEQSRRGQPTRRVEWRDVSGQVRQTYLENGERRAPDAGARAWIDRVLREAILESGVGAERRVARIRARGGVPAVLAEIERIRPDGAKRIYYNNLLTAGARLSDAETARVLRHAGETMESDGEMRLVLRHALQRGRAGPAQLAAVLDAAAEMDSDGEKALVLREVARSHPLTDARARDAFFRAAQLVDSDGEKALVLREAARHVALSDARARDAFFRATNTIGSDGEHALVLRTVLREDDARGDVAAAALRSAATIDSDGEKAVVLRTVPASLLRLPAVQAAYMDALRTIRSDGERSVAAAHIARNRQ